MTFSPEDAIWIEASLEAGDSLAEIAEDGGYDLGELSAFVRRAQHPALRLSDFHREVLSLWSAGFSCRKITDVLGLHENRVKTALQRLSRAGLIWPHEKVRQAAVLAMIDEHEAVASGRRPERKAL